jgi:hypothetical protein
MIEKGLTSSTDEAPSIAFLTRSFSSFVNTLVILVAPVVGSTAEPGWKVLSVVADVVVVATEVSDKAKGVGVPCGVSNKAVAVVRSFIRYSKGLSQYWAELSEVRGKIYLI